MRQTTIGAFLKLYSGVSGVVCRWGTVGEVSRIILNLIRSETGSQWSSNKIGVMWSYLREPVISRAAAFCTESKMSNPQT